tara:strand:- start:413 stop:541 length:129 start_codon:yes stop_codon:yes gene_type:complete
VVEQEEKQELLLVVTQTVKMEVQVVVHPLNQLLVLEMVTHLQ